MTLDGPSISVFVVTITNLVTFAFFYGKIVQKLDHHEVKISEITAFLKSKFGGI